MKNKNILTLLVCTGLGLSLAAPIAKADSTPAANAQQRIEAKKAEREAAIKQHAAERKAKVEESMAKKEARIDEREANKTARIEQRADNKEATIQAHKDANAAKKEILQKNRDAIKATRRAAKPTAQ